VKHNETTAPKGRFVRGTPNHSFKIVAILLGVSERTVKNMVDDRRLKSTNIVDVVEYIRTQTPGNSPDNSLPTQSPFLVKNAHHVRNT